MRALVGKSTLGKVSGAVGILVGLVALAMAFRIADAQGGGGARLYPPDPCGPILLQNGDHAIIGVLLPAVQRVREAARLVILNSSGRPIADTSLPAVQNQPFTTAFVDVYMDMEGGSVRIVKRATPDPTSGGEELFNGGSDGELIALLLPAVQRNGEVVYPTSATIQGIGSDGATRFVLPFKPPNPSKNPGPPQ